MENVPMKRLVIGVSCLALLVAMAGPALASGEPTGNVYKIGVTGMT